MLFAERLLYRGRRKHSGRSELGVFVSPLLDVVHHPRAVNAGSYEREQKPNDPLAPKLSARTVKLHRLTVVDLALCKPRVPVPFGNRSHIAQRDDVQRQAQRPYNVHAPQTEDAAIELGFALVAVRSPVSGNVGMTRAPALQVERHSEDAVKSDRDDRQKRPQHQFAEKLYALAVKLELSAVDPDVRRLPTEIPAHERRHRQKQRDRRKQDHHEQMQEVGHRAAVIGRLVGVGRLCGVVAHDRALLRRHRLTSRRKRRTAFYAIGDTRSVERMARLARPRRIRRVDVVAAIVAIDRVRHVECAAIGAILAVDKPRRLCDRLSGRILLLHRFLHGLLIDRLSLLRRLLIDRLRRRLLHRLDRLLGRKLRLLHRLLCRLHKLRSLLPCRHALSVLKGLIVFHRHSPT